ncbi:hypothetical protein [Alloalcanivorax xenomutans]|uniref:Lipoprotein n=1 Tax=Alloalcanivorax xenomutans TaxID=1094342 RepID=A0A9Q3W8Z3_9GAMM|nr:hypothetical protein [Alloalcanivorax xenomutans]MCE7510709.1 hypothetical protein [Alloalcanivorax xenomutans]
MLPPKVTTILLLSLLIIGCSSDVDTVRKGRLQDFPEYTVSQALENRDICEDTSWTTFTDSRGRKIVRYKCEMKGIEKYNLDMANDLISRSEDKSVQNQLRSEIQKMEKEIKTNKEKFEKMKNDREALDGSGLLGKDFNEYWRQRDEIGNLNIARANQIMRERQLKKKIEQNKKLIKEEDILDKKNRKTGEYILNNYKGTGAYETIDWVVIEDGTFMVIGGSLHEVELGQSEFREIPNQDIDLALDLIYQNVPSHYFYYKEALGLF